MKSIHPASSVSSITYDQRLVQFLSPDIMVQDPTNTQNYNRYADCLNNPMKYTDPTGYLTGFYIDECGNIIGWDGKMGYELYLVTNTYDQDRLNETDYRMGEYISQEDLRERPVLAPGYSERMETWETYSKGKTDKSFEYGVMVWQKDDEDIYGDVYYKSDIKNTKEGGKLLVLPSNQYRAPTGSTEVNHRKLFAHTHNQEDMVGEGTQLENRGKELIVDHDFITTNKIPYGASFDYNYKGEKTYIYDGGDIRFTDHFYINTDAFFNRFYFKWDTFHTGIGL